MRSLSNDKVKMFINPEVFSSYFMYLINDKVKYYAKIIKCLL